MPDIGLEFYIYALPIFALLAGALLLMLFAVSKLLCHPDIIFISTLAFIVTALLSFLFMPASDYSIFAGAYVVDGLAYFGQTLVLAISLCICLLARASHLAERFFRGDICCLFLLTVTGMLVMMSSKNLLTIFVGLEIFSLGTYSLIGYIKQTQTTLEAAIKYFILGSFAAAILLFGFAFIYASTGTLVITSPATHDILLQIGGVFTLVGVAFKLALVPCHLWAPDAYEGAPTTVTAFMATAAKVAIILLALRLFNLDLASIWLPAMTVFAALSMIAGNIMALVQNNLKRMLAYSSIAHGGYMAVALAALGEGNIHNVLYYLIAYCVISLGTFAIVVHLENPERENLQLEDLVGLAKTHPWLSFALAVFVFAFAGMPPTLGFFAKFFIFSSALTKGLYALVIIGVIGSVISFYYYLRVILKMYFVPATTPLSFPNSKIIFMLVAISLFLTLFLGLILPYDQLQIFSATQHVSYSY